MTVAPFLPRMSEIACPMPLLAPVIKATFPDKSAIMKSP